MSTKGQQQIHSSKSTTVIIVLKKPQRFRQTKHVQNRVAPRKHVAWDVRVPHKENALRVRNGAKKVREWNAVMPRKQRSKGFSSVLIQRPIQLERQRLELHHAADQPPRNSSARLIPIKNNVWLVRRNIGVDGTRARKMQEKFGLASQHQVGLLRKRLRIAVPVI